jgi:hypothetical protein
MEKARRMEKLRWIPKYEIRVNTGADSPRGLPSCMEINGLVFNDEDEAIKTTIAALEQDTVTIVACRRWPDHVEILGSKHRRGFSIQILHYESAEFCEV